MTNLLKNSDFENSVAPNVGPDWYGNGIETVNDPSEARTGSNYLLMSPTTDIFTMLAQDNIELIDGNKYQLSFWINPGSSSKKLVIAGLYTGDEVEINNLNTWQQYTLNFTANSSNTIFFAIYYDETENNIMFDDISIVEVF
jgi:hypothetical protein